tara:strand:- start:407 stop:625 length:219 start_codon:yes stop_codon:yes gene_type:complete
MIVSQTNMFTGKKNEMDLPVTSQQIGRWINGELIQNVMPELSIEQREFLKTGILPEEWDKMFLTEDFTGEMK